MEKIAYLANVRFPSERAHSSQIAHMCSAFVKNGYSVNLFVDKRVTPSPEVVESHLGFSPDFSICRIGFFDVNTYKWSFYVSEILFSLSFLFSGNSKKYQYIYSRHEWILMTLSIFLSVDKLIWESHEAKFNFPAKMILKKGIKTVVISEGIYEEYLEKGISENQMLVAHDAVDETFFDVVATKKTAREQLGLSAESHVVMYIGGFDSWKGVQTFFEAASISKNSVYVAIGGSEIQVAEYTKKYPQVIFLGATSYSDLKDFQQAADILVIPNTVGNKLSSCYTSPLKLFAHMTSGIPLLVSDIPSLTTVTGPELVTSFEADNPSALAQGVEDIIYNFTAKEQQALLLQKISKKYTWTERARSIMKFIST